MRFLRDEGCNISWWNMARGNAWKMFPISSLLFPQPLPQPPPSSIHLPYLQIKNLEGVHFCPPIGMLDGAVQSYAVFLTQPELKNILNRKKTRVSQCSSRPSSLWQCLITTGNPIYLALCKCGKDRTPRPPGPQGHPTWLLDKSVLQPFCYRTCDYFTQLFQSKCFFASMRHIPGPMRKLDLLDVEPVAYRRHLAPRGTKFFYTPYMITSGRNCSDMMTSAPANL